MRTVSITYNLFPISELSTKAVQSAYYKWLEHKEYGYGTDNRNTLDNFCEIFEVRCHSWSYDANTYNYRFTSDHLGEVEELRGVRLLKYLTNNYWQYLFKGKYYSKHKSNLKYAIRRSKVLFENTCTLTGYYIDDEILAPIYDFIEHPDNNTTFYELLDKCLDRFFKECSNDVERCESMEYFKDECEDNNYEFLEDGNKFS